MDRKEKVITSIDLVFSYQYQIISSEGIESLEIASEIFTALPDLLKKRGESGEGKKKDLFGFCGRWNEENEGGKGKAYEDFTAISLLASDSLCSSKTESIEVSWLRIFRLDTNGRKHMFLAYCLVFITEGKEDVRFAVS